MKVESVITIDAPPAVVARFFSQLDHLRFVSPWGRREWCPEPGVVCEAGGEYVVEIQQGRHQIQVRFRTVVMTADRYEDEFITWPLKGARHVMTFAPSRGGVATEVSDTNVWHPPWYARALVARHIDRQTSLFAEKMHNAKTLVERVFDLRGPDAFLGGIFEEAERVGMEPIVPLDGP